jgi:hypothetical protein
LFVESSYQPVPISLLLSLGGYSQNFLCKFVKISIALGLNILSFLRLKVLF